MVDTPIKNAAAQALGRLGGAAKTRAQNLARKRNAQRAGRPGRVCVHCGEPVLGGHVNRALDDTCGQHGWRWQQGRDAAPVPATGASATLEAIARILRQRGDASDRLRSIGELLRGAREC